MAEVLAQTYPSVSAVTKRLAEVLRKATDATPFWVRGELNSVSDVGNRIYFDLVETQGGKAIAKLRCHLWRDAVATLRGRLQDARLPTRLKNGMEVGVKIRVRFHAVYGLTLQVLDLDPEVTLGELARRRREIVARLTRDDLLGRNRAISIPLLPRRVGLVASRDTAGYADFVQTIQQSAYAIMLFHADARVQGDATERSILKALDALARLDLDLIIIIRGGGGKMDLAALDNEAIARRIAACGVAVWTGIGHETDESVLDLVAARAFKTPTAVAEALVDRFAVVDEGLRDAAARLRSLVTLRIGPQRERLTAARGAVARSVRFLLEKRHQELRSARSGLLRTGPELRKHRRHIEGRIALFRERTLGRIGIALQQAAEREKSLAKTSARRLARVHETHAWLRGRFTLRRYLREIARCRETLGHRRARIHDRDPAVALRRGYALIYDEGGHLVVSMNQVEVGMRLTTRLWDGSVESTVTRYDEEHSDDGRDRDDGNDRDDGSERDRDDAGDELRREGD